jgi:glycosyltransferase involved in cell wall biosynthesis
MHGMGRVSEIGVSNSLASAILDVLEHPEKYRGDVEAIKRAYDPDSIAQKYEKLFAALRS